MMLQDNGFLISINKYNENSAIADFFTQKGGGHVWKLCERLERNESTCASAQLSNNRVQKN